MSTCSECGQQKPAPVEQQREEPASQFQTMYDVQLAGRSELVNRVMDAMVNRPTR